MCQIICAINKICAKKYIWRTKLMSKPSEDNLLLEGSSAGTCTCSTYYSICLLIQQTKQHP